jgi:hypothetical protein
MMSKVRRLTLTTIEWVALTSDYMGTRQISSSLTSIRTDLVNHTEEHIYTHCLLIIVGAV